MQTRLCRLGTTLLLCACLFAVGCSEDRAPTSSVPTGGDDYTHFDYDDPYGGLTPTDEPVAFADPYYTAAISGETVEEVDDPLAADPVVLAYEAIGGRPDRPDGPPRPRFTFLRVTWGVLDGSTDSLGRNVEELQPIDWTGRLWVDRGIVLVRRLICFERPWDHLVWPRPDRQTVAWVSHTGPHYDGLLVEIIEPPEPQPQSAELAPNILHFETPLFSTEIPVAEMAGLEATYPVSLEGNAVKFSGWRLQAPGLCPKGFLGGVWHADDDSAGSFRGYWLTLHGRLAGLVRGGYGHNSEGERVLFGKYISRDGQFRGLLRGTWIPAERPGHGVFRGDWINAAGSREGRFGGEYIAVPESPGGFFGGRWTQICDGEAEAQIP